MLRSMGRKEVDATEHIVFSTAMPSLVPCEICLYFPSDSCYFCLLSQVKYLYLFFKVVLLFQAFEFLTLQQLLTLTHSDLFPPVVLLFLMGLFGLWESVVLRWCCLVYGSSYAPSCERVPSEHLHICFCQGSLALKDLGICRRLFLSLWFLNYTGIINSCLLQVCGFNLSQVAFVLSPLSKAPSKKQTFLPLPESSIWSFSNRNDWR